MHQIIETLKLLSQKVVAILWWGCAGLKYVRSGGYLENIQKHTSGRGG